MCKHLIYKTIKTFPNGDKIKECTKCGHKKRIAKNRRRWWNR